MDFLIVLVAILFSFLATIIMSYISMAIPIGPWIESTLVLLGAFIFQTIIKISLAKRTQALGLTTVAGGIAGSVAIACAFAFPCLYFLDPPLFTAWMNVPVQFCAMMAALVLSAGSLGFIIAAVLEKNFMQDASMPFPIGQLVAKTIVAQNQMKKAFELMMGIISIIILNSAQFFTRCIPRSISLLKKTTIGFLAIPSLDITLEIFPFLIAIGFVTGHVIAAPLAVGIFSKIAIIDPLHQWLFKDLSTENFIIAFTSGMVVQGAFMSIIELPHFIISTLRTIKKHATSYVQEQSLFASCIPCYWQPNKY